MLDIKTTLRLTPFLKGANRIPYEKIARAILGDSYELSLVICGDTLAQRMNKEYRKKTYKPNVLSFPIATHEGEIFLNARTAAREARTRGLSTRTWTACLFVHGCFHLKGLRHGRIMERQEERTARAFGFLCNEQSTRE